MMQGQIEVNTFFKMPIIFMYLILSNDIPSFVVRCSRLLLRGRGWLHSFPYRAGASWTFPYLDFARVFSHTMSQQCTLHTRSGRWGSVCKDFRAEFKNRREREGKGEGEREGLSFTLYILWPPNKSTQNRRHMPTCENLQIKTDP